MSDLLNRLMSAWDNLSMRERALVSSIAGILGCLLIYAAVISPIVSAADNAALKVDQKQRDLQVMIRLRREYDQIQARLASVERQIRSSRDRGGIRTLLSNLAAGSAVKIDSMEERATPDSDLYTETKMELSLKGVTLRQATKYLNNLENEQRMLSIKTLRVKNTKSRGDTEDLLDVTFTVSAFEPL